MVRAYVESNWLPNSKPNLRGKSKWLSDALRCVFQRIITYNDMSVCLTWCQTSEFWYLCVFLAWISSLSTGSLLCNDILDIVQCALHVSLEILFYNCILIPIPSNSFRCWQIILKTTVNTYFCYSGANCHQWARNRLCCVWCVNAKRHLQVKYMRSICEMNWKITFNELVHIFVSIFSIRI